MSTSTVSIPPLLPAERTRRWAWLAMAAAVVGLVYVYRIDPMNAPSAPVCLFHELTGLYCPGCGGTRAMHALLHGHLLTAIGFNPLIVVVIPLGVSMFLRAVLWPTRSPGRALSAGWVWTIFFALVGFWIARNIPAYPFTLLAP